MKQRIVTCKEFDKVDFVPTVILGFYQSEKKTCFIAHYDELKERFPNTDILGCSSESNIYDSLPHLDVDGNHLCVYMCLDMKKEAFEFEICHIDEELVIDRDDDKEYGTILMCSRYSPNVELLIQELPDQIGSSKIYGAVASNVDINSSAEVFLNGRFYDHHMLLWLIDQKYYLLDGMSLHYFRPVGFELEVTKVEQNVLHMLDNRPALDVLEEMVGELLDETIESFNHPLFIVNGVYCDTVPLCSIRSIDREKKSIELYRHLFVKDKLKVGIALSREEQDVLLKKFHDLYSLKSTAILFNCIGIKKNLGMIEYLYLMDLKKHLGVPIIGFHSFGEIGAVNKEQRTILHNQTISIAVISENEV